MGELVNLLDLERQDRGIERLEQLLAEIPVQIEVLESDLQTKRSRLEAAQAAVAKAEKKRRSTESHIEANQGKAQKLNAQLMGIKTNREYKAALAEIEAFNKKNSDLETEVLLLFDQLDELEQERQIAATEFEGFAADAEQRISRRQEQAAVLEAEKRDAETSREKIAEALEPRLLKRYEKLRKKIGNHTIAQLVKGSICGGCNLNLRPQFAAEVRRGEKLHYCENCNRFLYRPESPDEADPETH